MIKNRQKELFWFYVYFFIAGLIGYYLKLNLILFAALVMGVPSVYFGVSLKKFVYKNVLEALVFVAGIATFLDYVCIRSNAWSENSIFQFRLFGIVTYDILIWMAFYVVFIILFWEFFFDRKKLTKFTPLSKKFFLLIALIFALFLLKMTLLNTVFFNYFYLVLDFGFIITYLLYVLKYPKSTVPITQAGVLLFLPSVFHEVISLKLGHWFFTQGSYHIGYVTILSQTFPYEELFWLIIVVPVIIVLHEYFADNQKN